ncbi:MAG: PQQ-binding-like beta-propeller repeat protein [Acidimicrobiales bacterium]
MVPKVSNSRNVRRAVAIAVCAGLTCAGIATASVASTRPRATADTAWTVYHGNEESTGVVTALASVNTSKRAWTSPNLSGQIYGEPLVYGADVYVATENDVVYALSAKTGRVLWGRHLASAVPSSKLPCGDIGPRVGITGTPVIDPSRSEIFVVADELIGGGPEHYLVGLSTTNGAVKLRVHVDPPGSTPSALLQRTGLTLDNGNVIFAMGGNYGDCAAYRGRVVSVGETGSPRRIFTVDASAGDSQGAIWMGGAAPVVDAQGNVWVSTGNGSVNSPGQAYDDSDAVLEFSSTLRLKQYFAPSNWTTNNGDDLDMSTAPMLLADGQVVLVGKSRIAYLLRASHLGGIGHEETSLGGLCDQDVDGGGVVDGSTVYIPCLSGPVALRVGTSPPSLRLLWSSGIGGGPPLLVGHTLWTIGQNGVLYGLNPASGQVTQQANVGAVTNHFPTPSVGDGLLLVPTSSGVVAFKGTAAH